MPILARCLLVLTVLTPIAGVVLVHGVRPAYACTPPPGGLMRYTVAERTMAAELVLEGTVVELDGPPPVTATVEVHRYLKGDGPGQVDIAHFGPSSLCLSHVEVGQRLVFYARGDPAEGLTANYAGQFDAVSRADPETIAEVLAAVSGNITPTPTLTPTPTMTPTVTPTLTPTITPTLTQTVTPTLTPMVTPTSPPTAARAQSVVALSPTLPPPEPSPASTPRSTKESGGACSNSGTIPLATGLLNVLLLVAPVGLMPARRWLSPLKRR